MAGAATAARRSRPLQWREVALHRAPPNPHSQTPTDKTMPISNLEANRVFLHLKYNPGNQSSSKLQHVWKDTIAAPRGRCLLQHCKNKNEVPMELKRMTVAYSRQLNIGNLLSYRKLPVSGPSASSYRLEANNGLSHTQLPSQESTLDNRNTSHTEN